jgi:hypothetical protein
VKKQLIAQAELLPAVLARWVWRDHLKEAKIIHVVDNEGAKFALAKGYSPGLECAVIVDQL